MTRRDPQYDIGLRDLLSRLQDFDRDARSRGIDYVTRRRLAEALNLTPDSARRLHLGTDRGDRDAYAWPLRRVP